MKQSVSELTNLLRRWEDKITTPNYNPIPTLIKLCELFEEELKKYLKKDTDPFVDCHTFRIDHTCVLGQMYKILFLKDSLINKLVMDYSIRHNWPKRTEGNHNLNVVACRLILNLIPGLETTVVFKSPENDQFIQRLFTWAENTNEPLQTHSTGLLASCMELTHIAANFKENNNKLVLIILDRLHSYYTQFCKENDINQSTQPYQNANCDQPNDDISAPSSKKKKREENSICSDRNSSSTKSNACWLQIDQPTLTTKIVYCLKYLIPTGQYHEFLSHAYEKNALNLVMKIINSSEKQNSYLTNRALKYLTALLCHKKFATEFIDSQQLQNRLKGGEGISPISSRYTIQNQKSEIANSSNGSLYAEFRTRGISSTPMRLNVYRRPENHPKPEPEQEHESPLSKSVHKKTDQDLTLIILT